MFEKTGISKDGIRKIITALIIASVVFLSLSLLMDDNDSRKSIITNSGSTEKSLSSILSEIKGVDNVDVMVQYEDGKVVGVIVTARGADDPVVRNNIVKGVSTLFDIPSSDVMVFERKQEERE